MSEEQQRPGEEGEERPTETCCGMRQKVLVGILAVLPEEQCGVPDSELADFMRFDLKSPAGKPVIAFRYCPWCGRERGFDDEMRVVDIDIRPPGDHPPFDPPEDPFGSGDEP